MVIQPGLAGCVALLVSSGENGFEWIIHSVRVFGVRSKEEEEKSDSFIDIYDLL